MKKLITILLALFLITIYPINLQANVDVLLEVENNVEGYTYQDLVGQNIILSLVSDDDYTFNVQVNEDISDWFTNKPDGLIASVINNNGESISVSFTGQSESIVDELIEVVVPEGKILDMFDEYLEGTLSNNLQTEDSRYIIEELEVIIYYNEPSTINGYVGEELIEQYVYIKLENDTYNSSIIDKQLSLYNNLSAIVIEVDENSVAKVKYNGIPQFEDHSLIHTTINKEYLNITSNDLPVPDRQDVLFDIRIKESDPDIPETPDEVPQTTYSIPSTGIE